MRVSVMSPCLSVGRDAVAPVGKPDGFEPFAADDEHRGVDAGAVDSDFRGIGAIEGCGDERARVRRRRRANSQDKLATVPIWD